MSEHKLTVDVYASWADTPPRYRVYVDEHLLTERDFMWPGHKCYVKEHIIVELEPGEHTVRVEQVGNKGTIKQKDISINGVPCLAEFRVFE